MRPRVTYANVTATLALVVAMSAGAYAAGLGTNDVKSKHIAPGQVKLSDTNEELRLQCPNGTDLVAGSCIEKTLRTAHFIENARNLCAEAGRRLPSVAELQAYAVEPGVTLADLEWSNNPTIDPSGGLDDDIDLGVGETELSVIPGLSELPYRCVAPPKR